MATAAAHGGVPKSTLCPKFLHANSTSHTGPFSAIAELIDNAFDPDVRAKQFWIDKTMIKEEPCLSFMDNGNGLNEETMHKMLSFGYSQKTAVQGQVPIGIYGNGFKSGSMRLGKDAIVFSKSKSISCVGMLSQTYLEKIEAKQISVPIVCFGHTTENKPSVKEEHKASLQAILQYSPFKTQEELLIELSVIKPPVSAGSTGTRIIIWNLRRTSNGTLEFDFDKDRYDFRIPSDVYETKSDTAQQVTSYIPESVYSLRAYCRVLYLKPRMQMIIRGQKVKSELINKTLACIRKDHYKPNFLSKSLPITFGYNTKSKDQFGIMMYHKNRLIKAYERVGCQLKGNTQGVGVIGIIECDFLEPTHNKQSFNETDKYRKTMTNLAIKLEEYCKEIRYRWKKDNPNSTISVEDTMKRPDQIWVQCDDCLQWRKLPDGIDYSKLPDKWFCQMNPDPEFRCCLVKEEAEDDDQPSYRKTHKKQEREDKKQQKMKRNNDEEDGGHQKAQRHQEEQSLADPPSQNKDFKQQTVHPPATPTTPRNRFITEFLKGGAARADSSAIRPSNISQAACSPSSNDGLPVITNVCSLSRNRTRGKRAQHASAQVTPKRPRVNGFKTTISDTHSSLDARPSFSPSVPGVDDDGDDNGDDDGDDTDDDLIILENSSTPKPKKLSFNETKVKTEQEPTDISILEHTDDAAVDADAGGRAAATSISPVPPPDLTSTTTCTMTQTEVPKVKTEQESQTGMERAEQSTSYANGNDKSTHMDMQLNIIKQEETGDTQSDMQKGIEYLKSDKDVSADACDQHYSPHQPPSFTEAQEQQDQLLELMQVTALERDSCKEQVHQLTSLLQDLQSKLQELSQMNVKECFHKASQTEETQEDDYKSLYEAAKQKVDELIKDKEALLAAAEAKHSDHEKEDTDDIKLPIDCLIQNLDQRNQENYELRSQLDSVTEEKANLEAQCEALRLSLQQQREDAQEGSTTVQTATASSAQTRGGADLSGTDSRSDAFKRLIELRRNISQLLVTYIPALDLAQMNYECDVVDELLEQVLSAKFFEVQEQWEEA